MFSFLIFFNENCWLRFNRHSDSDSNDGNEQVLNLFVRRVAFFIALDYFLPLFPIFCHRNFDSSPSAHSKFNFRHSRNAFLNPISEYGIKKLCPAHKCTFPISCVAFKLFYNLKALPSKLCSLTDVFNHFSNLPLEKLRLF